MQPIKLNVVFYWVSDVDSALAFYRDLGLEPGPRYGDWQELQIGSTFRFALHGGRSESVGTPNAEVSIEVESLDEAIAELAEKGHRPIDDITDTGANRFATYADPDGNHIQVIEEVVP